MNTRSNLPELELTDVIRLADGREVRVRLGPAANRIARNWRGRVAVRNNATNRLSYVSEQMLRQRKALLADRKGPTK